MKKRFAALLAALLLFLLPVQANADVLVELRGRPGILPELHPFGLHQAAHISAKGQNLLRMVLPEGDAVINRTKPSRRFQRAIRLLSWQQCW